jgi:hypothetical protein
VANRAGYYGISAEWNGSGIAPFLPAAVDSRYLC